MGLEELMEKKESGWLRVGDEELGQIEAIGKELLDFFTEVKTEREAVERFSAAAREAGFRDVASATGAEPGDRLMVTFKDKTMALVVVGRRPVREGLRIVAAHIDSPRIDLKPSPLVEDKDSSTAILKTQYYGGIKKYQWVTMPLAIRGIVVVDGKPVKIRIGDRPGDPVLTITDLLPHLAKKVQGERKLFEGIEAEELNVLVGNRPVKEDVKERVKAMVLKVLNEEYGMREAHLHRADLEIVPAWGAYEVGLDRSMIGGYGLDDRLNAYLAFRAVLDLEVPEHTSVALFYDREEIGSEGFAGAQSFFTKKVYFELLRLRGEGPSYPNFLDAALSSKAVSADVDAAVDPTFKQVHDLSNAARLGHGVAILKYTGHGGKYGASEARAEYMAEVLDVLDRHKVIYQMSTLGKVDWGGGGTVAKFLARYGMDIVDMGVPVLSMHSPMEIVSKLDCWSAYRAFKVLMEEL